jgi:hypothetical protein
MILTGTGIAGSQRPPTFTFTVNTSIAGSSGVGKFQLPLVSSLPLNAVVDWGDRTSDTITTFNQAERLHTYAIPGVYTIRISGALSGWRFNNGGDILKMSSISSWGSLNITVDGGFYGCTNLTCSAIDAPIITTTTLENYFRNCQSFNANIGTWDVSGVSNLDSLFRFATSFNNGQSASINNWNVSNVTIMSDLFRETQFNQPLNNWDVSNVQLMDFMFYFAPFNQIIGGWDTSSVTTVREMFKGAAAFNQDIGAWNVSNVNIFTEFMQFKTNLNYSAANLDSIYNGWSSRSVKPNRTISFGTIKYTAAGQAGRDILTGAPNSWTIADGGI